MSRFVSSGLSDLGILCFEVNRLLINKWSALLGLFPIGFVAQLQPLTALCSAWLPGLAMHLLLIERFRKLGYKTYSGPVSQAGTQGGVL